MRIISGLFWGIPLITLIGCNSSDSDVIETSSDETIAETTETIESAPELTVDQFAGATFVSADILESTDRGLTPSHWTLSFTNDMVSWTQSEIVELGTFEFAAGSSRLAEFSERDIAFSSSGNDLFWDSQIYYRISSSLFDSQETLIANFDGTNYNNVENDELSVRFERDQLFIQQQNTIDLGTYSFIDNTRFNINIANQNTPAYSLFSDRLLLNSTLYERDFSNLFDSQESLVEFLDGTTYRSASLQQTGEAVDGMASIGFWFISFTDNTFMLSTQNGDEAGTVDFLSGNSFTAIFANREAVVETQGNDLLLDGVRYMKQ